MTSRGTWWYLSDRDWPSPNLNLLNNALRQTGWTGPEMNPASWPAAVRTRLKEADWARAVADVRPFLESAEESDLITQENIHRLLSARESH